MARVAVLLDLVAGIASRHGAADGTLFRYILRLHAFAGQPFVRVLNTPPTLKGTAGSNYCDISAVVSPDGRRAVIMSSIDNLMKGQSGTAMQNINLMFGLDPRAGLERGPTYP